MYLCGSILSILLAQLSPSSNSVTAKLLRFHFKNPVIVNLRDCLVVSTVFVR